jgi:hypothetical protein
LAVSKEKPVKDRSSLMTLIFGVLVNRSAMYRGNEGFM